MYCSVKLMEVTSTLYIQDYRFAESFTDKTELDVQLKKTKRYDTISITIIFQLPRFSRTLLKTN